MIGHYLLTLTPEQEDRVLTDRMTPGGLDRGCLLGVAVSQDRAAFQFGSARKGTCSSVVGAGFISWPRYDYLGDRYDLLCRRFGAPRINAAIRNRILSNRARRTLQNRPVEAVVPTAVRVCCEDTLIASPRRHETGFETVCTCGNIIRRHWAGGWEYFAPVAVSR